MKSNPIPFILAAIALLAPSLEAATNATSPTFTVDTRGTPTASSVSLSGRVLSKVTGAGLSGATLSIGGRTANSSPTGYYSFANVDLSTAGSTVAISKTGHLSQNLDFAAGAGAKSLSLPDAWLNAANTTKPVVEWIRPDLNGLLLPGWGVTFSGKTRINWNGNTPGSVKMFVNGVLVATRTGAGPEYSALLSVDTMFAPSLLPDRNKISVTATAADGTSIGELSINVVVLPVPGSLSAFLIDPANIGRDGNKLHVKGKIPEPAVKKTVTLPKIGTFGAEIQVEGEFNYYLSSGKFEFDIGPGGTGLRRGATLFFGNKEISVDMGAHGEGVATTGQGIRLEGLSLYAGLSYSGTFDFPIASALDPFGPGITTTLSRIPGLKEKLKPISLTMWVKPDLSGSAYWKLHPKIEFDRFKLEGKLGIDLGYEADFGLAKVKVYIGGEPSVAFQIPGDVFEQIGFRLYAGFEAKAWILQLGPAEYVFVEYSYPSAARRLPLTGFRDIGTGYLIEAAGNTNSSWQPIARPWREAGGEQFLLASSGPGRRLAASPALDNFAAMGVAPSPGAVFVPGTGPGRRIASNPALPAQAELPLLANVFPQSEPALAGTSDDLMLLYVRDTGAANPIQFTEVGWSFFDGTTWTPPAPVRGSAVSQMAEGFNEATVPAGWAVDQPGSLSVSFVTSSTYPTGLSPTEGSRMIRVNSYSVQTGTVRLRKTEPFSTAGQASAAVKFDWTVDTGYSGANDRVSVEWSTDGVTWSSFGEASRYSAGGNAWTEKSFNLPPAALGQPQVYVSFLFTTEYGNDCHMDNLRLELGSAVPPDPRGEFEPTVAFDGTGAGVAVWTRIKDAAFSGTELDQLAAQMEIVSAKWNPATKTWDTPQALTDNTFLDHKPRLAGPLTDGDLLLTWRQNESNLLIGTGAPGVPTNTRLMTRRWDAATATWGPAQVLIADLANELSDSLAARGNKAVLAITRDMDGNLDDFSDCEMFYRTFDVGTGTWSALTRHTTDAIHDRNARVALDASGNIYCVWQRGDDLVMDKNFSGTPGQVRPDSGTLGFSDFALTVGPGGNVVAVWQEMDEFGSDAHYRVFDPASNTWGLDTLLSQDSDLERSFAPVWDPMGNLVLAYNNVTITKQTMAVTLEGGGTIDVPGVPQPGQVDLLLAKRALVKDLSLVADSLTAVGTTFLPGDSVTFKAKVKNTGNVAEENVQVAFYDGDPAAGGTLIQTVTVPGWLKASDEAEVTATWTVPEPATARTAYVKVDPANAVTEFSETNNTQSLGLNGVDLDLQYVSGTVLRDGSVRVVVRIKNLGAPESPVATLVLKPKDGTDPLAEVSVSQLDPGSSVEIPLDLPAGSHPEGERSYRLGLDEAAGSGDIDTGNNETLFSLNLWIDDDGDGLPRWWEEANGMSDSASADASLDVDGDGFNAKAEYLAGTNPQDANSYLRPGEFNVLTGPDGTTCTLSWASVAGRLYRVERSYDLEAWETAFDDVPATPPLNSVEETIFPRPTKVFYRIIVK
jgi:hypothetical protein